MGGKSGSTTCPVLEVCGVSLTFGGVQALTDVRLRVDAGECVGVIGPNGAGKSTLLNCLSGLYEVPRDTIRIRGVPCGGTRPSTLVARGVKRTFQNVETFHDMSVRDVLRVGAYHMSRNSMTQSVLRAGKARAEERKLDRSVAAAAVALGLSAHLDNRIKDLPYGTQKRVDLARAFVGGAQLLLLDEPAAGMNDDEIADIEGALRQLRSVTELGMLLIEHHVEFVSRFTDRLYVLDAGRVIASGAPEAVLALPEVIEAYIGGAIED